MTLPITVQFFVTDRLRLPAQMYSRGIFSVWTFLKQCIGKVNVLSLPRCWRLCLWIHLARAVYEYRDHYCGTVCLHCAPPFPQIDIIGAVVIVWRVRGKTVRSVLCNIVCNNCAQCDARTYEQTNRSLDWVLSHWAHFTVLDSFFDMYVNVCIFCVTVYCMNV